MSTQKNLITLCIATVFTLGLAACGGGGSSPVTMMDDDIPMDEESTPAGGITLDAMAVAGAIGDPGAAAATVPDALMIDNGVPGAMSPLEASDAVDAAAISGWNASVTQRMTEEMGAIKASTDTVIIYNDQDSRARPSFADRHPLDADGEAWEITDIRVSMVSGVEDFPSAVNQMIVLFDADTTYRGMFDGRRARTRVSRRPAPSRRVRTASSAQSAAAHGVSRLTRAQRLTRTTICALASG